MFEVPQRWQLASVRAPLSLFAPVSSTVSCVPLTRNLSPADPFPTPSKELGTGNALLWYGSDTRCAKRLPVVRDAFSEALGAKNRLLRYGRDTRYRKRPPMVRKGHAVRKTASYGTRRAFGSIRCKKQASTVRERYSVPETPSYGTRCIFRGPGA